MSNTPQVPAKSAASSIHAFDATALRLLSPTGGAIPKDKRLARLKPFLLANAATPFGTFEWSTFTGPPENFDRKHQVPRDPTQTVKPNLADINPSQAMPLTDAPTIPRRKHKFNPKQADSYKLVISSSPLQQDILPPPSITSFIPGLPTKVDEGAITKTEQKTVTSSLPQAVVSANVPQMPTKNVSNYFKIVARCSNN